MQGFQQRHLHFPVRPFAVLILLAAMLGLLGGPAPLHAGTPLLASDFVQAAPQGLDPNPDFNDNGRQNSWAWSMSWWKGHLYVGTNRAWACATQAAFYLGAISTQYPPTDPDVFCPGADNTKTIPLQIDALPLRAEIWRWTPPSTWDRVYQSPNSSIIPDGSGNQTSREIGFRGMLPYTEADGTQAFYVTSCSPRFLWNTLPPPTILRTTDGVNFTPLPQDPGTTLGTFPLACWRNPVAYNGHFFVQGATVNGGGALYEADDPRGGNNNFQQVSPAGMFVSGVGTFNGHLYVGTRDVTNGYAVYETDAVGQTPYQFKPIVINGGYAPPPLNVEVLSMKVFQNHLYIGLNGLGGGNYGGTNAPAELIRVNLDDSWDVIAGPTRTLPDGSTKSPICLLTNPTCTQSGASGTAGFGSKYNVHMWRMEVFNGNLYVGTNDVSVTQRLNPTPPPTSIMGFDLFTSGDGANFSPVTTTGLSEVPVPPGSYSDIFDFGVRSLVATPYGLFLGTTNNWYGLKVYLGTPPGYQGIHVALPVIYQPLPSAPQPTATITPTSTSQSTATTTLTPSPTTGSTSSPTPTRTPHPTKTPTVTATKTLIPATDTPTGTATATGTAGATQTATATRTRTASPTRTPSATVTVVLPTSTATITGTLTPTKIPAQ